MSTAAGGRGTWCCVAQLVKHEVAHWLPDADGDTLGVRPALCGVRVVPMYIANGAINVDEYCFRCRVLKAAQEHR